MWLVGVLECFSGRVTRLWAGHNSLPDRNERRFSSPKWQDQVWNPPGPLFSGCQQWRTQEFFTGGRVQQIQLRTGDRENGDLGAVVP